MYTITALSRFNFGDRISFNSQNGVGQGKILDIVICADGSVYYIVKRDDNVAFGGILPDEVTLLNE